MHLEVGLLLKIPEDPAFIEGAKPSSVTSSVRDSKCTKMQNH